MKHTLCTKDQCGYESGKSNCPIEQTSCFFFACWVAVNVDWPLPQTICVNLDPEREIPCHSLHTNAITR